MIIIHKDWEDDELLALMDMKENEGLSFGAIGKELNRSRNACAGAYHRIVSDLKASEDDHV